MTLSRVLLAVALIAAAVGPVRADVELWTEAGVRWEPDDRFQLSYDQHLRFDRDVSRVSAIMEEPQFHYRPVRWFRTGVGYRAQYERDNNGFLVWRHRFQYDVRFRVDVGDFRFDYEPQFEYEYRGSSNDKHRHRIRNDFGAAYRRWKWVEPKASAEIFHPLWDFGETIHYEKLRLTFGPSFEYKRHTFDVAYRVEIVSDLPNVPLRHIMMLGYAYDLTAKKPKKPKKPKDGKGKDGKEPKPDEPPTPVSEPPTGD